MPGVMLDLPWWYVVLLYGAEVCRVLDNIFPVLIPVAACVWGALALRGISARGGKSYAVSFAAQAKAEEVIMEFELTYFHARHPFLYRWARLLPLWAIIALVLVRVEGKRMDFYLTHPERPYLTGWPFSVQAFAWVGLLIAQATLVMWGGVLALRLAGSPIAKERAHYPDVTKQSVVRLAWLLLAGGVIGKFVGSVVYSGVVGLLIIPMPNFHNRPSIYDAMLLPTGFIGWVISPFLWVGIHALLGALRNPLPWVDQDDQE